MAKQQFNVYLDPETVRLIKHRAIDEQISLSDLVEKMCRRYIQENR
ncbi:ribbon-helix-helix protein, CopG family [Nocardioides mangrovicus]|uniref:Ribbon-helix-helix protein, CopG family n=1 Tax=Nocardioides mangrovicus TaxID=2478913 RepID=A0A3L8P1D4_9ACTN|nr:ribbon-helix-helix protein, CopG family [Nocardioides mangrovicus]RLV48633.1 ribbon-helix-helix protein, CopG family [Nocardioides mangrovicus]